MPWRAPGPGLLRAVWWRRSRRRPRPGRESWRLWASEDELGEASALAAQVVSAAPGG